MAEVACFAAAPTVEGRTIRGLLLPWATPAADRPLQFARGSTTWAADEAVLRLMHDGATEPPLARLGRGMTLEDTPEGIVMVAELAKTTRADDALALIEAGVVAGLSAEVAIHARDRTTTPPTVTRATLTAGALVPAGAFTDATLFARQAAARRAQRRRVIAALG